MLPTLPPTTMAQATPEVRETPLPPPPILYELQPPADIDQRPLPPGAAETLKRLMQAAYPTRDYHADEIRLTNSKPRPRTVESPRYVVGDVETFYTDEEEVEARLAAVNDRAYFWFAADVLYDEVLLAEVSRRVQDELYPAVTAIFGQEWTPGVDNDSRLHILHLAQLDTEELGYFTSGDEYPQTIFTNSNEREMIYINMDLLTLGGDYYYGTLIHELQHLIQWHQDSNEETWLDEGLAQLAEHIAGHSTVVVDDYLLAPNLQLNSWNYDEALLYEHYSASALFLIYFWEQLGDAAVHDLATHPANGLASVEAVLHTHRPELTLAQFISNWYIANFLNGRVLPDLNKAAYVYDLPFRPPAHDISILAFPYSESENLAPYGVRYIELPEAGQYTLSFVADTAVDLIDAAPHSGSAVWLAPGMNNLSATLTGAFDLTAVETATLEFWVWHDLEQDYDFLYVAVSTDQGQTWQVQAAADWAYGYYGPALSGQTGWVKQAISLDSYGGRDILIRFEALTDSGVYQQGVAIDDIAIPELGYFMDVESGAERWQTEGFVPATTVIPQNWSVQLIHYGANAQVESFVLDGRNQLMTTFTVAQAATLVIAPVTPFTLESGRYWLQVARN